MKKMFHGYYTPTAEEFEALWNDSLIVLDASALLNLYSYSSTTLQEFLELLSKTKANAWLPYQAAAEYHRNRCRVIRNAEKKYEGILSDLRTVLNTFKAEKTHPYIEPDLLKQLEDLSEKIIQSLTDSKESQKKIIREDLIRDRLNEIYDGQVGEQYSPQDLEKIYAEGKHRYADKVPPGFKDETKLGTRGYGDLVLWRQIIKESVKVGKGVIFVTDDEKPDWWLFNDTDKIGPRPELLQEFRTETTKDIYIYTSFSFAEHAKERGEKISEPALAELAAADTARDDQQRERINMLRGPVAGYEDPQRELINKLRGLFTLYEDPQRELINKLRGPVYEYEKQQRKLDRSTRGEVYENDKLGRELRRRLRGPFPENEE